jgi:hypothetical protein
VEGKVPQNSVFAYPLSNNLIPHIGNHCLKVFCFSCVSLIKSLFFFLASPCLDLSSLPAALQPRSTRLSALGLILAFRGLTAPLLHTTPFHSIPSHHSFSLFTPPHTNPHSPHPYPPTHPPQTCSRKTCTRRRR